MALTEVLSMWEMTRGKFTEKVMKLEENELSHEIDGTTIGKLIYHTADVEFIFSDWFFDYQTSEPFPKDIETNKAALVQFLQDANAHFIQAMKQLDESKWNEKVASRMGDTTPAEAVARLIYHTGIHSGQITTIQNVIKGKK